MRKYFYLLPFVFFILTTPCNSTPKNDTLFKKSRPYVDSAARMVAGNNNPLVYEQALKVLNQGLEVEDDNPYLFLLKAQILCTFSQYKMALSNAELAVRNGLDVYPLLGTLYAKNGKQEQAMDAFKRGRALFEKKLDETVENDIGANELNLVIIDFLISGDKPEAMKRTRILIEKLSKQHPEEKDRYLGWITYVQRYERESLLNTLGEPFKQNTRLNTGSQLQ